MTSTMLRLLALPALVLAQQSQFLFVDGQSDEEYAASVVNQDACGTTLNLVCTAGMASLPAGYGAITCDPSGFESGFASAAATYSGDSIYQVSQSFALARNGGIDIQVTETCSLYGTTSAICSGDVSVSTAGIQTILPAVTTLSGAIASAKFFQVAITDGSITTDDGASCTAPASFTTPAAGVVTSGVAGGSVHYATVSTVVGSEAGASSSTAVSGRVIEFWTVVAALGAAVSLAGAAFL